MESCIICKDVCIKEFVKVGPKGRTTLVAASLERQDGLHEQLQAQDTLVLHIACRKAYTRKSTIKSEKRKSEKSEPDEELEAPTLRAQTPSFNIATQCLFCSEELITSHKIEIKRRKLTSNVETIDFKKNVIKRAKERGDEWGEEVVNRIEASIDLVAAEGKYHRACAQDFYSKPDKLKPLGKPVDIQKSEAFDKLCAYIDENDECQYTVSDLMEHMETFLDGEEGYSLKYFKQKLKERYKDDIIITSIHGKTSIVSFRESAHRIIREKFVIDKAVNKGCENELIIEMAASIIRDDIRMSVYDLCEYPTLEETENGSSMVPESLRLFLHNLLDPKGKNPDLVSRRSIAIAHSLISTCRTRSFILPVLLAISVYIHRKYASQELIDFLSSLGFADDYREVRRFENSLMATGEPSYNLSDFTQFVFDNADFNVATLTGHNTFHAMGGIACVTPPATVEKPPVKRMMKVPPAVEVGTFGHVPIKTYRKLVVPALQSVTVEPLQISDSHRLQVATFDSIWMLGYILKVTPCLPWSGFMKTVLSSDDFHTSRIETLPFINLDPGNLSTIYTALSFAQTQCEKHGLKICPVTFDQPLYLVHNNNEYALLDTFMNKHSTHQHVQEAGESFLLKLYGARSCESLDQHRYIAYNKAISRTSLSSTFQLASLPPTSAAAKQHSYRAYLTVQEWMGRSLQPTAWGWRLEDILTPVETDHPIAPDTVLNMISCGCRADGCGVLCGCRKMGVNCSALCSKCTGQTCNNAAPVHLLMDIEGDPEESTLISPQYEIDDDDECDDEY